MVGRNFFWGGLQGRKPDAEVLTESGKSTADKSRPQVKLSRTVGRNQRLALSMRLWGKKKKENRACCDSFLPTYSKCIWIFGYLLQRICNLQ